MIKTFVQRAISYLPRREWWNGLFQKYITKGLYLEAEGEFRAKLGACQKHYAYFRANSGRDGGDFTAIELGTGWFPILPLGLYLCGASAIQTYDIAPLVTAGTLKDTLRCFLLLHDTGALAQLLPASRPERMEALRQVFARQSISPRETLGQLGIQLMIGDVRRSTATDSSVDFIFSNGVLEHLPRRQLQEVFSVFRRWLRRDGVMSHHIGLADQFASFDRSITPFNFLRYSRRWWRWLDNPIIPQNRLRHSDYLRTMAQSGFEIVAEEKHAGRPEDLARVPLSRDFRGYDKSDLLIVDSWVVARPAGDNPADRDRVAERMPFPAIATEH